jgi:hypothetical protein
MPCRTCTRCGKRKRETSFSQIKRTTANDGYAYTNLCLVCRRAKQVEYYHATPSRKSKVAHTKKNQRLRVAAYICDYLRKHPCVDCGESDIVVLDFDHVRGTKKNSISRLRLSNGIKTIQAEIAKCEVRCANCHRRKTARQHGWKHKMPRKHK